jgi:hypothetical protein
LLHGGNLRRDIVSSLRGLRGKRLDATTVKPLPASPARAASIVALSASKLVWRAMSPIKLTTSPIFCAALARFAI